MKPSLCFKQLLILGVLLCGVSAWVTPGVVAKVEYFYAPGGTLVSYDYVEPTAPTRSGTESGLDDTFYSHYSCDGYMELQVFDPEPKCTTCPCPEDEKEEKCKCQ